MNTQSNVDIDNVDDRLFFFFNDTATTEIYTLSLHDALPILRVQDGLFFIRIEQIRTATANVAGDACEFRPGSADGDRKSTRLNSSHSQISYAVFCLKQKKAATKGLASENRDWIRDVCDASIG